MATLPRKARQKSKAVPPRVRSSRSVARLVGVRKTKPTAPNRDPGGAPPSASLPTVRVRMYRQGLGDCFLLTFNPGGDEKHVLIDCGTLGAKYTDVKLPDVIADIDKTSNGHLHLVVATHQHQDHLSGFPKLSDQFSPAKSKQIDHAWLAWTENPNDKLANSLGKTRDDMAIAAKSAAQALHATSGNEDTANAVDSLLGFFGDTAVTDGGATFAAAAKNSIDCVRGLVKQAEYRSPGEPVIEPDWLPGFRFYVLGPPRDIDAIHDTGAHGSPELYALTALTRAALQKSAGDKKTATGDDSAVEAPFDQRYRLLKDHPLIVKAYGKTYLNRGDPSQRWRTVDTDWLNGASALAIQLDSFTNNTSLVLAIERIADGKVLLFPGDAQEGNWLSWQASSISWQINMPNGKTCTVTAKDLLARTVFYKVGHHSSHNATAKAKGLEMMTSQSELTAFIPVDRRVALGRSPAGTWKMPARQLYRALLDKCQGRVVRSDTGWASDVAQGTKGVEAEFAALGTQPEWLTWTKSQQAAARVQIAADHIDFLLE
jgi:hypothetical protein